MVTEVNIQAAARLRSRLLSWDYADNALDHLRKYFDSNVDHSHVLAKASAIDKLYSTRGGNIYWLANAVVAAMVEIDLVTAHGVKLDAADVVNAVSRRKSWLYPGSDRCASFASKYCHFFVDGWDFLIYDSFALAAVNNLLGERQYHLTPRRSEYRDFCERVERLLDRNDLKVETRDLDRYLWLWGQWLVQRGYERQRVNRDVFDLFKSDDPAVRQDVALLAPVA